MKIDIYQYKMPGIKGKSGGSRDGSGRPPANDPKQYFHTRISAPSPDDSQGRYAIEWFRSLTPDERLDRIAEIFDTTGEFHGDTGIYDAYLDEKFPSD